MTPRKTPALFLLAAIASAAAPGLPAPAWAGPVDYLEDQFEIPDGFRVYRAAGPALTGGSYALTTDGQGRLLVADGKAVRRLIDGDGDGVFDGFEIVADDLGNRGPQGLLVYGDKLFAVARDGLQVLEGYGGEKTLGEPRRLGETFNVGGDHGAHSILRGHDGHIYLVSGDGGGTEGRRHISEATSPALFERKASVFRISPDGAQWECVSSGGRNPPNVGMNYLGDLFSWDSDMEWHVDLPFYRPLRLNHWVVGGDQGWQGVDAYPPYFLDAAEPVLETGRGSPCWGTFYEHDALPAGYRDSFLVADYLWKSATSGRYNAVGRLVAFHLERDGAGWKASMEVLARPVRGAVDRSGTPINFALVDVTVAADGSLFVSDHNQGVWRIFYDPEDKFAEAPPPVVPPSPPAASDPLERFNAVLRYPQPSSEYTRLREEAARAELGAEGFAKHLQAAALDPERELRERLRAVRLMAPGYRTIPAIFLGKLASANAPELRARAAWLLGLRSGEDSPPLLQGLLADPDPLVRRSAAEALTRSGDVGAVPALLKALADPDRRVAYSAMTALSHRPLESWLGTALETPGAAVLTRALAAAHLRREEPDRAAAAAALRRLMESSAGAAGAALDRLRILGLYRQLVGEVDGLGGEVGAFLLGGFPADDPRVRWEQVRLLGLYAVPGAFVSLLDWLENQSGSPAAQFHTAQAIARLEEGWDDAGSARLAAWHVDQHRGWFAQTAGKGRQFPDFWGTVLTDTAARHSGAFLARAGEIDLVSQLGSVVLDLVADGPEAGPALVELYRSQDNPLARRRVLAFAKGVTTPEMAAFLRGEFAVAADPETRAALVLALSRMPFDPAAVPALIEGLGSTSLDTVVACGRALIVGRAELSPEMADALLGQIVRRPGNYPYAGKILVGLTRDREIPRELFRPRRDGDPALKTPPIDFWKGWYEKRFGKAFAAAGPAGETLPPEAIAAFLAGDSIGGGDPGRGLDIYRDRQCYRCHGGGATTGLNERLFGPDLTGVTQRLNRQELAEAIVFPSRVVAERFRATVVKKRGGDSLTGFITAQDDDAVALATEERVHRIPRGEIETLAPQEVSLMPPALLAGLDRQQLRDLYAYLEQVGRGKQPESDR